MRSGFQPVLGQGFPVRIILAVVIDGFGKTLGFGLFFFDLVPVILWGTAGKFPKNPRKISRILKTAGPCDFRHVEVGGFEGLNGSDDAHALNIVDKFFVGFRPKEMRKVVRGTLQFLGDGLDIQLRVGELIPNEPLGLKDLSDVAVQAASAGMQMREEHSQQGYQKPADNGGLHRGVSVDDPDQFTRQGDEVMDIGRVKKLDDLDIGRARGNFAGKVKTQCVTVKAHYKISKWFAARRLREFLMRDARRHDENFFLSEMNFFPGSGESRKAVQLKKNLGFEMVMHRGVFLKTGDGLGDFKYLFTPLRELNGTGQLGAHLGQSPRVERAIQKREIESRMDIFRRGHGYGANGRIDLFNTSCDLFASYPFRFPPN